MCERQLGEQCNCMVIKHTPSGVGLMIRCPIIPVVRRYDVQALDVILLAKANGLTWNTSQDMDNRPYPPFLLHDPHLRSRGHHKYLFSETTSTVPVISSPPVVWRNVAWRCLRYSWRRRRSQDSPVRDQFSHEVADSVGEMRKSLLRNTLVSESGHEGGRREDERRMAVGQRSRLVLWRRESVCSSYCNELVRKRVVIDR